MFDLKKNILLCIVTLNALWGTALLSVPIRRLVNDDPILREICNKKDLVLCVTIPKSGSHLLVKCLALLGIEGIEYEYNGLLEMTERKPKPYKELPIKKYASEAFGHLLNRIKEQTPRRSFLLHLPYAPKFETFFNQCTSTNFLMIRDPRDQLISLASTSMQDPSKRDVHIKKALLDMLLQSEKQVPWAWRHRACDVVWSEGIVKFYKSFLAWTKNKKFSVIRFENLVGPQGGGTTEAQIKEIKKITKHLGVSISDDKILEISHNLYGDTLTFQKGQSQQWKQYFTPRIKKAFKSIPGACKLLIDLGYEKDCKW